MPVHLYGQCADMPAIKKIADKHKLHVIEDNAQGIDAAGDTFKIGELSDAATTSFIIQKNLGCVRRRRRAGHQQRAGQQAWRGCCATTVRRPETSTASASTAAWMTSMPAS
jgi:hypothetical protein